MDTRALLGVKLPIVQAPMAGSQGVALAAAVSNAGGLGSLPCALLDGPGIARALTALRDATDRPYNVNFFCHREPSPDEARERAYRALLAPYYRELGLDPAAVVAAPARSPFGDEAAALVEAFRPPVVSFHFGLPEAALLGRVKATGAKVLASATTVDEARWLAAHGADVIIAQGLEAGGHRGLFLTDDLSTQVGTIALVRQIVLAVRVPVIAAGGIADRAGVQAALLLGAVAAQLGTAYLLCPEASTLPHHRAALTSAGAGHTALTNLFTGRPARGIVNRLMRELGPISDQLPAFPLASGPLAALRVEAERRGLGDFSSAWAGQNASSCRVIPAAELTRALGGASLS